MTRTPFLLALLAAGASPLASAADESDKTAPPATPAPFVATELAQFAEPWAMTFLPDGSLLVTEKAGTLKRYGTDGRIGEVSGVPQVAYRGQGGLGDVVLHPKFADNGLVYLSYAELDASGERDDDGKRGAAVARAHLVLDDAGGGALSDIEVIWRQIPKVEGAGHYSHRIAFAPDGNLFISSGERQKFDPAQDMQMNLGKIIRLHDDGRVPADNPYQDDGDLAKTFWSIGHRNVLGLAFDAQGRLWEHEMGPQGGDELNLVVRGRNYGYPIVSNGSHYDNRDIPDHDTRPEFEAPKAWWTPVISPAGLVIYSGDVFPEWKGDAFIGGLSSKALVRIEFDGDNAREAARYDMGQRIREVEQSPDGGLWLLEDGTKGSGGRLLKLEPKAAAPAA